MGVLGRLAVVIPALVVAAEVALATGYATDDSGVLYRVLPDERKTERIGVVQVTEQRGGKTVTRTPVLTDIANSDLAGLYGISFTHLYKINMRDPTKSTRVGALGGASAQFNALAFDDRGRLFALEHGVLFQVNLITGKATALGSLGGNFSSDGDLAFIGDALYASVNSGVRCHLVRIDPKTWKAKDLGAFRQAAPRAPKGKQPARPRFYDDVWGLIWDGRSLFALTPQGEVLEVDRKSATVKPLYRTVVPYYGACPMLRI